jgi:hypothetical protein
MATNEDGKSTQSMQYDKIGTKYNTIKTLPAAEPEEPSVVHALGNIEGMECLGTSTMIPISAPAHGYSNNPSLILTYRPRLRYR